MKRPTEAVLNDHEPPNDGRAGNLPPKPPFYHSLSFRIGIFNVLGFVVTSLVVFTLVDRLQRSYLLNRIDRVLEAEILVITAELDSGEIAGDEASLTRSLQRFSRAHGIGRSFFRAFTAKGEAFASSDLTHWPGVAAYPVPLESIHENPFHWETAPLSKSGVRIIYYKYPEGLILQIGHDLEDMAALLQRSRWKFGGGMVLILVLGSVFGWFSTLKALRGIHQVSRAATVIRNKGDLDTRVPWPTGSAETDQLAITFNAMLDKIKLLIRNLRHVMDHIAHDIKTPVTRMRGLAETELRNTEDADGPELAGHVVEECDHILNLVNTLLEITAAEAGLVRWRIEKIDLADLVREGCELFAPVIENKGLGLKLAPAEPLWVTTDGRALQRVVSNLLDNAVKYTASGGEIEVRLEQKDGNVLVHFRDTGIGIGEEEIDLIFDRFHRGDRSRSEPGSGLGLSYCRAAIRALGGEVSCRSRIHEGSSFTVQLPLEAPHTAPSRN